MGASPTYEQIHLNKTSKYDNSNDDLPQEEYTELLKKFTMNTLKFSEYSFVNIQSLSNNKLSIIDFMYQMKNYYADTMIWDKMNSAPALPKNVLNAEFEYVHIFSEKANRNIGTIPFHGNISNIVHINKQQNNEYSKLHNATFPIELPSFFISKFAKETVLDLFGGTGTTLIACEQLNRNCFMMELSPKYCQIIINRWEEFTGEKATKLN